MRRATTSLANPQRPVALLFRRRGFTQRPGRRFALRSAGLRPIPVSTVKHAERRNGKKHSPPGSAPDNASYLESVGQRVRALRALRNMTRRVLAVRSGVSERFLAEVESGTGN